MGHIVIGDVEPRVSYNVGSFGQSAFSVPFPFFSNADLRVWVDGALKTITTHYTVTGAGESAGGIVNFVTPVVSAIVLIERETVISRVTDFPDAGPFRINALNTDLDRIIAICQEMRRDIDSGGGGGGGGAVTSVNMLTGDVVLDAAAVGALPVDYEPTWAEITGTPTTLAGYGISDAQPLDGDLTSIAGISATDAIPYRAGANSWAALALAAALTFSGGTLGLNFGTSAGTVAQGNDSRIVGAEQAANKGNAGGYAGLDGSGKVPTSQLPASVLGALSYQSSWNASTNSPTIPAAASGNKGWYYVVGTAGTTSVDGVSDWQIGDWIVSNGATWEKIDNTDAVASVAGLTGIISAASLKTALNLSGTNTGDQTITLTSDVTGTGTGSFATTIANDVVSNAKLANMAQATIKGRAAGAGTGDPTDLSAAQVITLLGLQTVATSGAYSDLSGKPTLGTVAALNSIDLTTNVTGDLPFSSIAQIATARIVGRVTASTGDIEALTGAQATTLLDVFTSSLKGLVPSSGGGTSNFLRADGTWAAPPGGGGGGGDMYTSVYDQTGVADDAFDRANHFGNMPAANVTGLATVATTGAYADLSGKPGNATSGAAGLMPAGDKTKIDYITVTQAVDLDAIETRVNALDAAVILMGTWNAGSGSFPGSGSAQAGESWIVSGAGTVNSIDFAVNDRIIAITDNASTSTYASNWHKADYTDQVLSVAGLTGAISASNLRTALSLVPGTDVQVYSAALASWASITRASGFDTFAATPSSANLRALITDEVGTGSLYFVGGALGTPASGTLTNATGLPVSTGLTGLGTNVATFLGTPSSANLAAAVTDETGSGLLVFATSPTLTTPNIGTPSAGNLSNCSNYPGATTSLAGIVELATAAEYIGNTSGALALTPQQVWAAAARVTLTDAATITANFSLFINSQCALAGNRALGAPSGATDGQCGVMWFTATTSSRTLTLNAAYVLAGTAEAGPYTITTSEQFGLAYHVHNSVVVITAVLRTA